MPSMPLSGVRISWLTVARKRDFARLAACASSRACGERALGLDAVGDIAADALHFGAGIAAHRDLAPGDPAAAGAGGDFLVVDAGAVRRARRMSLCSSTGSWNGLPISASRPRAASAQKASLA